MEKLRNIIQKNILSAARNHGNQSDPEMEVGDLQDALMLLIQDVLTPEQLKMIATEKGNAILELIEQHGEGTENFHGELFNEVPEFVGMLTPKDAMSIIIEDDTIELKEPGDTASYSNAFTGIVYELRPENKYIAVVDGNDQYFDVEINEVLAIQR